MFDVTAVLPLLFIQPLYNQQLTKHCSVATPKYPLFRGSLQHQWHWNFVRSFIQTSVMIFCCELLLTFKGRMLDMSKSRQHPSMAEC
jgi:hypothetical protein